MRHYIGLLVAVSVMTAAAVGGTSFVKDADAHDRRLADGFEHYPASTWAEGSTHGPWQVDYNGYGGVGIGARPTGTKYHYQKPMAATAPGETHASMIVSTKRFAGVDMTLRQKTVRQLRTGSEQNPWEVAWVVWGYRDDLHFYYFIFKTNGIELGKVHPGYPGAQRYLYTSSRPRMTIGRWNTIRVRQVGTTIDVWVDGVRVVRGLVDSPGPAGDQPYTTGKIGMYNEDAYVRFDDLSAVSTE